LYSKEVTKKVLIEKRKGNKMRGKRKEGRKKMKIKRSRYERKTYAKFIAVSNFNSSLSDSS